MPWFVAKRPASPEATAQGPWVYRVVSDSDIEAISPEWDWASSAFFSQEDAEREAEKLFWDEMD